MLNGIVIKFDFDAFKPKLLKYVKDGVNQIEERKKKMIPRTPTAYQLFSKDIIKGFKETKEYKDADKKPNLITICATKWNEATAETKKKYIKQVKDLKKELKTKLKEAEQAKKEDKKDIEAEVKEEKPTKSILEDIDIDDDDGLDEYDEDENEIEDEEALNVKEEQKSAKKM